MTAIIKSIHRLEEKFDRRAEQFAFHHPYAAFFAIFVGMPICILVTVTVCTMLITLPVAWLFGWL